MRRLLAIAASLAACAGQRQGPGATAVPSPGPARPEPPPAASSSGEHPTPAAPDGTGAYGLEPDAAPTALERATVDAILARLPPAALRPVLSPALVLAGRAMARQVAGGEPLPASGRRLREALAAGYAFDPAPVALLVTASPPSEAPAAVARMVSLHLTTRLGVGADVRDGTARVVVLLSRRTAALRPFPRDVAPGSRVALRGELLGLSSPRIFVTTPDGDAREEARGSGRTFDAPLAFDAPGRYLVELVGSGPNGPEVAALLAVHCGAAPQAAAEPWAGPEPESPEAAEAQVVAALNTTRARRGLPPLRVDRDVAAVARSQSERMRRAGLLAHAMLGSGDAGERLRAARLPYRRVLENIAFAASSLAAHRAAEESPAHLRNVLDPGVTRVGCGIARGGLPGGTPGVYLTEIFVQPPGDDLRGGLEPEIRVKEALWRERDRLGRPSLLADARLDALARAAAQEMLRRGDPRRADAGGRALALGRKVSAVDAFVAESPVEAARSINLADPQFRRVGVGVAVGDTSRYGAGRLWIAVVYTD